MSAGSTNNPAIPDKLKFGLFNAENLFLLFDQEIPPHYLKLNEAQWQRLSSSVYENKALQKCIQIAQIVKAEAPDVFMLCEVGGLESLKNFNKLFLENKYDIALIEGNSDRNIDVGFLIKKDFCLHYSLKSHKERPLNFLYPHENLSKKTGYPVKKESQFFSRDCVQLEFYNPSDSAKTLFIVLLTHLKSRLDPERIDPGGTERRTAELRTCLDIYKELKTVQPECPIIFAGDMNGFAGKPNTDAEFNVIYNETDLEDVLEIANVSVDKRSTFYQIKSNSRTDGKQIDYCFISKQLHERLIKNSAEVYRYKDEFGFAIDQPKHMDDKSKLPSDHYPLFFSLEMHGI